MPAGFTVERAVAGNVAPVVAALRDADCRELEALEGRSAASMVGGWIRRSSRILQIRGNPAVLYGIEPCADLPGHAVTWCVAASSIALLDMTDVVQLSRRQLDLWQGRWPVLVTLCAADNAFHRQWVEWLGFELRERLDRFGAAAQPFCLYHRRRRLAEPGSIGA